MQKCRVCLVQSCIMIVPKSIVCYCRRQLTELQGETNTQISKLPLHIVQQTQSSTVIPTFQRSKHKRILQSWFSLIWNKCKHKCECAAGVLGAVIPRTSSVTVNTFRTPPPALTRAPADTRWVIVWCGWELAFIRENIGAAQPLCWLFHQGP